MRDIHHPALRAWLDAIPPIPREALDSAGADELATAMRATLVALDKIPTIESDEWCKHFVPQRAIVGSYTYGEATMSEPTDEFAPLYAARLGDKVTVSRDGVSVAEVLATHATARNTGYWSKRRLGRYAAFLGIVDDLSKVPGEVVVREYDGRALTNDEQGVTRYGSCTDLTVKIVAPDHDVNVEGYEQDACGYARCALKTRTPLLASRYLEQMRRVQRHYERYCALFGLATRALLPPGLAERVYLKQAVAKLNGGAI